MKLYQHLDLCYLDYLVDRLVQYYLGVLVYLETLGILVDLCYLDYLEDLLVQYCLGYLVDRLVQYYLGVLVYLEILGILEVRCYLAVPVVPFHPLDRIQLN